MLYFCLCNKSCCFFEDDSPSPCLKGELMMAACFGKELHGLSYHLLFYHGNYVLQAFSERSWELYLSIMMWSKQKVHYEMDD